MKRMLLSLLMGMFPVMAFGTGDGCTENGKYANQFKIDRRCYVTDEQKQQSPFNATVALVRDKGKIYCTGAIIKEDDGNYLITAKHCLDSDEDGVLTTNLNIRLQDGQQLTVDKLTNTGSYDTKTGQNTYGDWAFFKINEQDVPYVERTTKKKGTVGRLQALKENISIHGLKDSVTNFDASKRFDVYVVGYGALEIMSDQDIHKFKERYADTLKENNIQDEAFNKEQVIYSSKQAFKAVLQDEKFSKEWGNLFSNKKLVVSACKYSANGFEVNCQSWGGNSGGPIFDQDNNIIAIHTMGNNVISENPERHAYAGGSVSLMTPVKVQIGKRNFVLK